MALRRVRFGSLTASPLLRGRGRNTPQSGHGTRAPSLAFRADNDRLAIAASKKSTINSLGDLLKIAKPQAGKFNWAATAGIPYIAFAGFLKASDIDMTYVPYRDFTPALSDVDEGRIDVAATALYTVATA